MFLLWVQKTKYDLAAFKRPPVKTQRSNCCHWAPAGRGDDVTGQVLAHSHHTVSNAGIISAAPAFAKLNTLEWGMRTAHS